MKKITLKIVAIAFITFSIISCSTPDNKTEKEPIAEDVMITTVSITQPEESFYNSLIAFSNGNNKLCAENIKNGIDFIEEIKMGTTDNNQKLLLDKEINHLGQLAEDVNSGKISSEKTLRTAFQKTNKMLAGNEIIDIETLVEEELADNVKAKTHSLLYYLQQAERNTLRENKTIYHEIINDTKELNEKVKNKSKKELISLEKNIKSDLHKIETKLESIDDSLEGSAIN